MYNNNNNNNKNNKWIYIYEKTTYYLALKPVRPSYSYSIQLSKNLDII